MLELKGVHAYYGASHVVQGVDMRIVAGECAGLLGRNGAGRSTLLKAVMGMVERTGSIRFQGVEVSTWPIHEIARLGIAYVPETRAIFPTLTVRQNLVLGVQPGQTRRRWNEDAVFALFPNLRARADTRAAVLSGGERLMLALGRALMGSPDLILIDEPSEGLAPMVVQRIGALFIDLAREGVTLLLVEQKLELACKLTQRAYVLGHGQIVYEGATAALAAAADVRAQWLEV
ncbi:MAG: ABC transporter ATP-binding protein [Gammaproteobacteria bacterium]